MVDSIVSSLVADIVKDYGKGREALLPILQEVQQRKGHISREDAWQISKELGIPIIEIYSTITFYDLLWIGKRAEYEIRVCGSISCGVNNGARILEAVCRELDVEVGGISKDGRFYVEKVSCLGRCDESPVMMINDKVYTKLTPEKTRQIIRDLKLQ